MPKFASVIHVALHKLVPITTLVSYFSFPPTLIIINCGFVFGWLCNILPGNMYFHFMVVGDDIITSVHIASFTAIDHAPHTKCVCCFDILCFLFPPHSTSLMCHFKSLSFFPFVDNVSLACTWITCNHSAFPHSQKPIQPCPLPTPLQKFGLHLSYQHVCTHPFFPYPFF